MKPLVAEDHIFLRRLLEQTLTPDYDVIVTQDGNEACYITADGCTAVGDPGLDYAQHERSAGRPERAAIFTLPFYRRHHAHGQKHCSRRSLWPFEREQLIT